MLRACAPGHNVHEETHHYWVYFRDKSYRNLPKGEHGKRDPEIEIGHIRKMIRNLHIDEECARKHLEIVR